VPLPPLIRYVLKRLLFLIPILLGISIVAFTILHLTPGDPVTVWIGTDPNTSPEAIQRLRTELGLDDPVYVQYIKFLERAIHGDFGRNIRTNRPVLLDVAETLPRTLLLTFSSIGVAIVIGIPIGIYAATHRNSIFDNVSMVGSLFAASVPNFWLALILILAFSYYLGLTPIGGYGEPKHLILPSLCLGTILAGALARFTRSNMLEVIRQDYVRAARAKGLDGRTVVYRHALRNALIPILTVLGLQIGSLLSGSFFVETVFAWPGIGRLAIQAVQERNYAVVQASLLVTSVTFVIINLVVDILYAYIDPRVQYE